MREQERNSKKNIIVNVYLKIYEHREVVKRIEPIGTF